MIYEHHTQKLLPRRRFIVRQLKHVAAAGILIAVSLAIGTVGYKLCEGTTWIDSAYDAAMILTGMGPPGGEKSSAGKMFLIFYSIFSGVVFLTAAAVLLAPVLHRVMHALHAADADDDGAGAKKAAGSKSRK
ncbi:MAG: hypothetical protein ACREJO_06910 [Phycisphaerales bacterium]